MSHIPVSRPRRMRPVLLHGGRERPALMVATSSFGLRVNYAAIRYVYCYGLPYSMEEFSQQCGCTGRDGKPSSAILMVDPLREKFKLSRTEEGRRKKYMEYLLVFATAKSVCSRRLISRYFDCTEIQCSYIPCEWCDVCQTHSQQQTDYITTMRNRVWRLIPLPDILSCTIHLKSCQRL